jgi:uncharacterized protein with FMN-binding domain
VKRISYWVLSTISAVVLLYGFDASRSGSTTVGALPVVSGSTAGTTSGTSTTAGGTGGSNAGSGSGDAGSANSGSSSSGTKNGATSGTKTTASTVTGSVAQTQWGPVQIRLTVTGSKITRVSVLQYPNGNSRDVEIAQYALPVLIRETLQSQSASIDMVSGATYTSTGYVQSLQSALDQANL